MRLSSLIMLSGLTLITVNQPTLETTVTPSESSHESIIVQVNDTNLPEAESQSSPRPHRGSGRRG